jgi:sec-independent protein translocase protein TatC
LSDLELTGGAAGRPGPGASLVTDAPTAPEPILPEPAPPEGEGAVMSLVDHLSELRRRLIISALAVMAGTVVGVFVTPRLIELLKAPVPGALVFTTLGGAFFIQLKLAFLVGLAIAFPILLYQLWAFVSPGLTDRERRTARPWIPIALALFVAGIVLAYVTLPFTASFLLSFAIPGVIEALITAEAYFDFVTMMFLAFGVVLEFPIMLILLTKLGLVSVGRLRSVRRYVLLGMVILAVVITPGGDPIGPAVLTVVMYGLYEGTILLLLRSRRTTEAVEEAAGG